MERLLFEEPFSATLLFSCSVYAPKTTGYIQEALTQTFLPFFEGVYSAVTTGMAMESVITKQKDIQSILVDA